MSDTQPTSMLPSERRSVASLAGIFSLRMFGLFMLLPVLSIYAKELPDTTPLLMGTALGVYGLTQAIFQIPFGLLSDKFDRKSVIIAGLVIFGAGSVIAAQSESIYGLIIGRGIQGAGAISAALLALTADLTRSSQRTKSMALIGICIGFSFVLALVAAPLLQGMIGVSGLFWMLGMLSIVAVFVLIFFVPGVDSSRCGHDFESASGQFIGSLKNFQLMQLNIGIFISHLVLTALFLVIPVIFITKGNYALAQHWKIYFPVLLLSALGMAPFIAAGSNKRLIRHAYRAAILLVALSFVGMIFSGPYPIMWLFVCLVLFFSGFNALESVLPSMVTQLAGAGGKGTAVGIYHTFQFAGVFVGGVTAGGLYGKYGVTGIFIFCSLVVFLWLLFSAIFSKFSFKSTKIIEIGHINGSRRSELLAKIGALNGVEEVSIVNGGAIAYLEVNESVYEDAEVQQLIKV